MGCHWDLTWDSEGHSFTECYPVLAVCLLGGIPGLGKNAPNSELHTAEPEA